MSTSPIAVIMFLVQMVVMLPLALRLADHSGDAGDAICGIVQLAILLVVCRFATVSSINHVSSMVHHLPSASITIVTNAIVFLLSSFCRRVGGVEFPQISTR